ncbi:hypothetical protein NMG60_11008793 [Bertholletia excelsa]
MERRSNGKYKNPCLTMHQPWASLLVHGIKRIEGRSWPAPIRGRLWIHAASKVPDDDTIKVMEDFYREIYALDGITDLKFPQNYPVSRLIGCVEVVGCITRDELSCWNEVPEGVRLEALTNFCWLCERPQKLLNPAEMRGYQGVYDLERKMYEATVRGLVPVQIPLPVKFPLPDARKPFSLKPGSVSLCFPQSKAPEVEKSSSLTAAITAASAAATQFLKKDQKFENKASNRLRPCQLESNSLIESKMSSCKSGNLVCQGSENGSHFNEEGDSSSRRQFFLAKSSHQPPPKIFVAAIKGLRSA